MARRCSRAVAHFHAAVDAWPCAPIRAVDPRHPRSLRGERYRGGQSFYVVPRIADLDEVREFLAEQTPELKVATAHGQLTPGGLEDVMTAFYDGKYDVLLSTAIVESGLDIPNANTLIVHRADMFGPLYQLKAAGAPSPRYAYFTRQTAALTGAPKSVSSPAIVDTLGPASRSPAMTSTFAVAANAGRGAVGPSGGRSRLFSPARGRVAASRAVTLAGQTLEPQIYLGTGF